MNDTLIFLALAGLALIFKWLTSQASGDAEKPEPPLPNERTQSRRVPPQSEEERVRRFLEALGAPPGTQPPPPVRPRPVVPRRVVTPAPRRERPSKVRRGWAQPLPPLTTAPLEPVLDAVPPPVIVAPPLPVSAASPPPTVSSARRVATAQVVPRTALGSLLRTRGSVRQAIILREVLGPPRGLQALDDLRSF
jgi:hypothetical protein